MHQASNLHNIIKIGAWAEPYVNFIYRETPPFKVLKALLMPLIRCTKSTKGGYPVT